MESDRSRWAEPTPAMRVATVPQPDGKGGFPLMLEVPDVDCASTLSVRPVRAAAAREAARAGQEEIIARYRAGAPLLRIAEDYGVSETWLRARLAEWGVTRRARQMTHLRQCRPGYVFRGRMPRRTADEVQAARARFIECRAEVIDRYREGLASVASLAREFAVTRRWVAERLDEWKTPRRDRAAAAALRGNRTRP
ncbi:hypothetical protein ABZ858_28980 [Streptomyces sp. NPDC047017]|uniref:hypothetical protein n=1 Tax=Streptomyces sp. NPDC047017 TaxID=3155024 RepID=UPI0033F91C01